MIRLRPRGVLPLEVWDLPVEEEPLQKWRRSPQFPTALATALRQLRARPPSTWPADVRAHLGRTRKVHLVGGGANEPGIPDAIARDGFSVSVTPTPREAAALGGLRLRPGAVCVDVGQTALKLADEQGCICVPRDTALAPHRDDTAAADRHFARASTIRFLGDAIRRHARQRPVVLALPCEVSDDGVASGCTYCWERSDPTLLRDLADAAGVDWNELWVLNDAELAAASAPAPDQPTLVVTIGFAVGASLRLPSP